MVIGVLIHFGDLERRNLLCLKEWRAVGIGKRHSPAIPIQVRRLRSDGSAPVRIQEHTRPDMDASAHHGMVRRQSLAHGITPEALRTFIIPVRVGSIGSTIISCSRHILKGQTFPTVRVWTTRKRSQDAIRRHSRIMVRRLN